MSRYVASCQGVQDIGPEVPSAPTEQLVQVRHLYCWHPTYVWALE